MGASLDGQTCGRLAMRRVRWNKDGHLSSRHCQFGLACLAVLRHHAVTERARSWDIKEPSPTPLCLVSTDCSGFECRIRLLHAVCCEVRSLAQHSPWRDCGESWHKDKTAPLAFAGRTCMYFPNECTTWMHCKREVSHTLHVEKDLLQRR